MGTHPIFESDFDCLTASKSAMARGQQKIQSQQKNAERQAKLKKQKGQRNFLKALAEREEANRLAKMTSIIFIRDRNARGQEISGYVDYAHRLKTDDFDQIFQGKKRLLPRSTDLSFYNWETQRATLNPTPNYQVIAENTNGLLFKSKRDRKIINVDPKAASPGDNSVRLPIETDLYTEVVIYDHVTRRKT